MNNFIIILLYLEYIFNDISILKIKKIKKNNNYNKIKHLKALGWEIVNKSVSRGKRSTLKSEISKKFNAFNFFKASIHKKFLSGKKIN